MYRCWKCGAEVRWQSDFNESEIYGEELPKGEDRVESYYICPSCGSEYEFTQGIEDTYDNNETGD